LLGNPTIGNRSLFLNESTSSRGFTVQPAINFGAASGAQPLLAADASVANRFHFATISNAGVAASQAAVLSTSTSIIVQTSDPPAAQQPDGSQNLDSGDRRISASVYQ